MAIGGLRSPEQASAEVPAFNPNDRAELALAVVEGLGRVEDRDKFLEGAQADLKGLADRGISGETVPYLPFGKAFTPKDMIEGMDSANYPDGASYPQTWPLSQGRRNFARRLWFPEDPSTEGYSIAEINRLDVVGEGEDEPDVRPAHMRVLLEEGPEVDDPLLQFLGKPYDGMYAEDGQKTQLDALAAVKAEMEGADEGIHVSSASMSMLAALAMQRRLEGKDMPFQWGWARVLQLGRKSVDGYSVVGYVDSRGGEFGLDGAYGHAGSGAGAVVSVGLKES